MYLLSSICKPAIQTLSTLLHTLFIDGEVEAKEGFKESIQGHTTASTCVRIGIHDIWFQSPFGDEGWSASDEILLYIQAGV